MPFCSCAYFQGFVCGWSYWFARALSVGLQLVVIHNVMHVWVSDDGLRYLWVSVFWALVVIFNLLNIRRYGEIEYWITFLKIVGILGIIVCGIILPMGASIDTRQLCTDANNKTIACNGAFTPIDQPGFKCKRFRSSIAYC